MEPGSSPTSACTLLALSPTAWGSVMPLGRIPPRGERFPLHDRGKVFVQTALMLAGGGESCADIEHLRLQETCSDRCLRTRRCSAPSTRSPPRRGPDRSRAGRGACEVWRRAARRRAGPVIFDIDASLVEIHSENKGDAPPTRAALASTRCSVSPTPPARCSPRSCGRATPGPTPRRPCARPRRRRRPVTNEIAARPPPATTPPSCSERRRAGRLGRVHRGVPRPAGAQRRLLRHRALERPVTGPSSLPSASRRSGSRPSAKTVSCERVRRCAS